MHKTVGVVMDTINATLGHMLSRRKIILILPQESRALALSVSRALAPLRRIVARDLKVFEYQRFGPRRPLSFVVIDSLECGHSFTEYLWDFRDLINGYSDAPHVTARRHRCHECRDLVATKKPVRSVAVADAAVSA